MSRALLAAVLFAAAACTPTFNWREITVEPVGLHAMLPCKPDRAEHRTELAPSRPLVLHAVGCEAGDASYAVLYGDVGNGADVSGTLALWKKASLAGAHANAQGEQAFHLPGAAGAALVRAQGQRPDGAPLQSQAAYFARGTMVFQAMVYAGVLKPEMTEAFFAGLRFE
jgi:hypothetical protein